MLDVSRNPGMARAPCVALLAVLLIVGADAQPPPRTHVRHIEFHDVTGIRDEVLRREMVQLEGAVLDTVALEQSRRRLEGLPYIEHARIGLRPVEGEPDLVDVVVTVEQAPARRYGLGGAYSESLRGSLHGHFVNENLFGTGQRFAIQGELGPYQSILELSHTEPYARPGGIRRTVRANARRIDQLTAATSALRADLYDVTLEFGYRTGEAQSVWIGGAVRDTRLAAGEGTSAQLRDWIAAHGDARLNERVTTRFREAGLLLRWRHDTRDTPLLPNQGMEQTAALRAALPGSGVEYLALDYRLAAHRPFGGWTMSLRGQLGVGRSYGGRTTSLPPYLNWFAGGPDTVRGYRDSRLGPRDDRGNPYGGNVLISTQLELMRPLPGRWGERMRAGVFYDIGNVFLTQNVDVVDAIGRPLDFGFDASALRHSAGVAVRWLIPIGTLRLSYGWPLNADDDHPNAFLRDEVDRFQIALGVNF